MLQKKICMLGSFAVGKTSLVRRFVESIYHSDEYLTTVGVTIDKKVLRTAEEELTLVLWDLSGDDAFQQVRMSYLRGMSGYLLVVDGTRRATLDKAVELEEKIAREMGKVPFIFALNKSDLAEQWEIQPADESTLAARGWTVLRTSAKTGESVEDAFARLAHAMMGKQG
jgi:small GTP-binding protein